MSTLYRYTVPVEETTWKFPASGEVAQLQLHEGEVEVAVHVFGVVFYGLAVGD